MTELAEQRQADALAVYNGSRSMGEGAAIIAAVTIGCRGLDGLVDEDLAEIVSAFRLARTESVHERLLAAMAKAAALKAR